MRVIFAKSSSFLAVKAVALFSFIALKQLREIRERYSQEDRHHYR